MMFVIKIIPTLQSKHVSKTRSTHHGIFYFIEACYSKGRSKKCMINIARNQYNLTLDPPQEDIITSDHVQLRQLRIHQVVSHPNELCLRNVFWEVHWCLTPNQAGSSHRTLSDCVFWGGPQSEIMQQVAKRFIPCCGTCSYLNTTIGFAIS